jgi:hypothetical protein
MCDVRDAIQKNNIKPIVGVVVTSGIPLPMPPSRVFPHQTTGGQVGQPYKLLNLPEQRYFPVPTRHEKQR